MTKNIKNPGLGGVPYNDSDSMLFEMLGVYRRPNLPRNPDGPGPATPPNPGGNVPGGKSNSGGGGKSGGGKGKGPQVDKTPPGQMKGGGGGGEPPPPPATLNTVGGDAYSLWARRTAQAGNANDTVTLYDTTDDAVNLNATTGEWTCPQSGYYSIHATGAATLLFSSRKGIELQRSTGGAFSTFYQANAMLQKNSNSYFSVSLDTVQFVTAGHKLRLKQIGSPLFGVYLSIVRIWSSAIFMASKAAASGAGTGETITNYDSVIGWNGNYEPSSYFNTTTGVFTCPEAGRWVFTAAGEADPPDPANTAGFLSLRWPNSGFGTRVFNLLAENTSYHSHGHTTVLDLQAGDEVFLAQFNKKKLVNFCGYKIHDDAAAFHVHDIPDSGPTSAANTTYAGYGTTLIDTHGGMNATTGIYTVPTGKGGKWMFSGQARQNPFVPNANLYVMRNGVTQAAHNQQISSWTPTRTGSMTTSHSTVGAGDSITLHQANTTWYEGRLGGWQLLGADSGLDWLDPNG